MSENLIIGCVTMAVGLAFQCVFVSLLFTILLNLEKRLLINATLFGMSSLLITVMLALLAGNLLQMTLWAGVFFACGEFTDFATAFYHSVVNFSTLGYGDVVMSEQRRLLGALEAVNGVLMFGLTTGFLFAILWAVLDREWDRRVHESGKSGP